MKLVSAVLITLLMASAASATPGDMGCEGKTADGKIIDVLIGYDYYGQGPSLLEVSLDTEKVFYSTSVKQELFNVGTEKSPFIMSGLSATDSKNNSLVQLKWLEQEPSEDGTLEALLTLSTAGNKSFYNADIKCYR